VDVACSDAPVSVRRIGEIRDATARLGDQAVDERHRRRRGDDVDPRLEDDDERVRLLGPVRHHAARPSRDGRAEPGADAVGEQGARERVALEPLVLGAGEPEPQDAGSVDPGAALGESRHGASSEGGSVNGGYVVSNA
jgi:hypothetical protein